MKYLDFYFTFSVVDQLLFYPTTPSLHRLLRLIGEIDTKSLLASHALSTELVIGRESRRVGRFRNLSRWVFFLQRSEKTVTKLQIFVREWTAYKRYVKYSSDHLSIDQRLTVYV